MFSSEDKKFALNLARRSIEHFFETGKILQISPDSAPESLRSEGACFVTLTIGNNLRGCIGSIEPTRALYEDIISNALSAAFEDYRFNSLQKEELASVDIEISILTPPAELSFSSPEELLSKLEPGKSGVIISLNHKKAVYLPQVWEGLSQKEEFLSSLCLKADLAPDDWKKHDLKVWLFSVETASEE